MIERHKHTNTFPLVLDMILHIEVHGDISSHTGGPALPNIGLGNLYYGERADGLSHPGPAPKHRSAVLRLPAQRDRRNKESDKCCGLLSGWK